MKFAKMVFIAAGVWGIVVVTPLYFLVDVTGRQYAAPLAYPHGQARIPAADAMTAAPDLVFGVLFIAAFAKTPAYAS